MEDLLLRLSLIHIFQQPQKETEKSQEKSADLHCDFQQVGFQCIENRGLLSNNNPTSTDSTKNFNQTSTLSSSSKDISKTCLLYTSA